MSDIKLVRVDDRLVHAQVLLVWLRNLNINTVLIVDDQLTQNPFLCEIFKLSMPSHITLHIRSIKEALSYDHESSSKLWTNRRTLVLLRDLSTARELCELGFPIPAIQIGGGIVERGLDKRQLLDLLLRDYHEQLSYLISKNVTVFCQSAPQSTKIYLNRSERA